MENRFGTDKAVALRKFEAVATLDKPTATELLIVLFPGAAQASPAEFKTALGLCVDYGLDPRLGELFMIPFDKKDKEGKIISTTFSTVRALRATRKIAHRRHSWKYLDNTPRYMTEEEEKRVYKTVDPDKVRFITILEDVGTHASAPGYGQWAKTKMFNGKEYPNTPKGLDKGNSMENMSAGRSERAALERLYSAEMPANVRVIENVTVEEGTGRIIEATPEDVIEGNVLEYPGDEPAEPVEASAKELATATAKATDKKTDEFIVIAGVNIDRGWFNEALKTKKWNEATAKSWLGNSLKVSTDGKWPDEVLAKLTKEQLDKFMNVIK